MTPKEEAEEIFVEMLSCTFDHNTTSEVKHTAKQASLVLVDKIISLHKKLALDTLEFYIEVKKELEKR